MTHTAPPFTQIAYDVSDHVATITLDRPDRLNAFTVTMQRELCAAVDLIDADPDVRAVVVTGRGRGFCAGADLGGGGASFDHDSDLAAAAGVVKEADGRHRQTSRLPTPGGRTRPSRAFRVPPWEGGQPDRSHRHSVVPARGVL